ncbi:hypothetical protein Q7P37_003541 [Cladosporium fusiforme]
MSDIEARALPTRGRSSMRGGRGGFGRGGARGGRKAPNGTSHDAGSFDESLDDQGELGEMKKKYASELSMLKDMFPDWTDVDLVFALDEADGDLPSTVDMITEGNVSQFAEVKKPKDRARSKATDGFSTAGASDKPAFAARGGRGRGGIEGSRGRGGRGSDRARGGFRGGRGGHAATNGAPKETNTASVPTAESSAWDTPATEPTTNAWNNTPAEAQKDTPSNAWSNVASTEAAPAAPAATSEPTPAAVAPDATKSSATAEAPAKKSWASMFAQPKPAPVAIPKQAPKPAPQAPAPVAEPAPAVVEQSEQPAAPTQESAPTTTEPVNPAPAAVETPAIATPEPAVQTPQSTTTAQDVAPATPHEPLTQENVEHLPDDSHPPSTMTAASTVGSNDPRNLTPVAGQQPPIGRPPVGGFATSALRAAATSGRSASFQRRVQEQQEAVVMPGHNAVDRAAVQFGSMGLNGEPGPDVDEEREEPETRQAPQHSPPTQPKASLPAAPRQAVAPQEPVAPEGLPTPKQAPGLGPASQQNQPQNQTQPQESVIGQGIPQEQSHLAQNYNQYAAYGQAGMQQDAAAQQQKPYDPFSHQAQYDRFGTQPQQPSHSGFGGLSSAPNDYSSYYTADPQRNAYGGYYGTSYAPQQDMRAQTQQDAGLAQQRSTSGFGAASTDSAFGAQAQQQVGYSFHSSYSQQKPRRDKKRHQGATLQAQSESRLLDEAFNAADKVSTLRPPHLGDVTNVPAPMNQHYSQVYISDQKSQQTQSRYGEAPGSGHNTPNPIAGSTQQQSVPSAQQTQHPMHQAPSHHQQYAGFPYGHPYYNSPYQAAYQNQFGYQQPATAYGGYQGKQGGMYGAPYGSSYEQHSSSPANAGAFNQNQQTSMRSTSGLGGSGLDDYARTSAQSGSLNQTSGFGGVTDPFARTTSGFGQSSYAQQPGMTATAQDESLKPFSESKNGPSPSLGQPGRPGSAANSVVGSSQSGIPQQQQAQQQQAQQQQQQQQQQSAFGGYGGFPSQGNQYGGLGGLGGQQGGMGGQQGGYGAYGASAFGQYGGYGSRGGWGQSYGAH